MVQAKWAPQRYVMREDQSDTAEHTESKVTSPDNNCGSRPTPEMKSPPIMPRYPVGFSTPMTKGCTSACGIMFRAERQPEKFDGSEPWGSFLYHFKAIAKSNGWDIDTMGSELGLCMVGNALSHLLELSMDERKCFESIVRHFEKYFEVVGRWY